MKIDTFPNEEALAEAVAQRWLLTLRPLCEAAGGHQPVSVALSGGRIALRYFSAIAKQCLESNFRPENLHFFWADERCVPPAHPDSNFGEAHRLLLAPLGIGEKQIHRIRGDLSPSAAVTVAEEEIRRLAPLGDSGMPLFDLVLLGMGEDGHIASLFPGEAPTKPGEGIWKAVFNSPKPPPIRITLTYPVLEAAARVWLIASGASKQRILEESVRGVAQTPLALLLRSRRETELLTDIPLGDH